MNEKEDSKMGCLVNDTLREVMENSEDYFFVKDLELVYQGSSIVLAKMIGVDEPLQLIGKNDYDLFPREIAEKFRCDDRKVLESGRQVVGFDLVEVGIAETDWNANVGARALFYLCNVLASSPQ